MRPMNLPALAIFLTLTGLVLAGCDNQPAVLSKNASAPVTVAGSGAALQAICAVFSILSLAQSFNPGAGRLLSAWAAGRI